MSSQISCNGADRENRMLQLYEELQLLPAELCYALYSAGDRTDFGIPGMRQVFGYR